MNNRWRGHRNQSNRETTAGHAVAQVVADPTPLESGILGTIVYRDLFDYPVTVTEIHRYLHGTRCTTAEVAAELERSHFLDDRLVTDGTLYALAGRADLFDLRRQRAQASAGLWPEAIRYTRRLACIPFVRMVAVTGSLAVDNADTDADVDFMLVTDGGRLWSCRLAANLLRRLDRIVGHDRLCPNYLRSTRALALEERSLYVAQELTQMVPLYGLDVYVRLRRSNTWTDTWLPNTGGAPPGSRADGRPTSRLRRPLEAALRSPAGHLLEHWERRRKLHRYNQTAFLLGRYTPFAAEATGHRRNVGRIVERAFEDRLESLQRSDAPLRILFGQAYHLSRDPKLWREMQPFPPLGSLYAAAVARELGHIVRVHDSMLAVSPSEWSAALQVNRPDVVVLYEDNFNYLTKMCLGAMRDAALQMIDAARRGGATVLVCSSDSADEPGTYLDAGADYVLIGEGEETLRELLAALADGHKDPRTITGLAYLRGDGNVVHTPRRPVIRNLDALPLPAWDLIDVAQYTEVWQRRHGRAALNMVTTRGCPYHCNWCAKPIWGQRYNARSPERVVDEIALLGSMTPVDYIWFMDDIFGLKPRWIARFADALNRAGIRIRFKCLSRPDLLLRDGEIAALARAGCDIVWIGAESGSQKILDAMEKGTKVEHIIDAASGLREHGIRLGLFIQFGYPGETRSDIAATIDMIRRILPDELGISVSYPLPGTPFYERVRTQLGTKRHWRDSDDLAMLFKGPFHTRFYRSLHRFVHWDTALRRAWRELSHAQRRRTLGPRRTLRKALLIAYAAAQIAWHRTAMATLARLPNDSIDPLPTALSPTDAARPSSQPRE